MPARGLEALVAVMGVLITLAAYLLSSPLMALSTAAGAIFAAVNFSLSRYSLRKILAQDPGRGQLAFGLLYVTKFFALVLGLALLIQHVKLSVWGLVLGFTTLPAAMYALLALELFRRVFRSFKRGKSRDR